jgi:hypothetical protein
MRGGDPCQVFGVSFSGECQDQGQVSSWSGRWSVGLHVVQARGIGGGRPSADVAPRGYATKSAHSALQSPRAGIGGHVRLAHSKDCSAHSKDRGGLGSIIKGGLNYPTVAQNDFLHRMVRE